MSVKNRNMTSNFPPPEKPIVYLKPNPFCMFFKSPTETVKIILSMIFLFGLIPNVIKFLNLKNTDYFITTRRITVKDGVFNLKEDELLFFRIVDLKIITPFFYRFLKISDLYISSLDFNNKIMIIKGIPYQDAQKLKNALAYYISIERKINRADIGMPGFNQNF